MPDANLAESQVQAPTASNRQRQEHAGPATSILSVGSRTTCLGIVDRYSFTRECISQSLQVFYDNLEVRTFPSLDDCMNGDTADFDLILFHIHESDLQQPDRTIASLKPAFRSLPIVILSDVDAAERVLEALDCGARGYIPTGSTSIAVAAEVIRLVRAGGTFVPASSLQMMRPPHPEPRAELELEEPLTARQLLVLKYLTLGKSNKIIAYELGMSESTVKVHIRKIMKKVGATNRTEAAFRARTLCWTESPVGLNSGNRPF
jgi:DNA-binding NarL/FixJ family response regulator